MSVKRPLCIVHIGLNKTGSTSIQAWLDMNREALRRQGIWTDSLAPHGGPELTTAVGWAMYGHSNRRNYVPRGWQKQAYRIHDRTDLDTKLAAFLHRVEAGFPPPGEGTYVTSSEHIGAALKNVSEIQKLHDWFAERFDRVRYVVYIREQADWLASAYVQAVRSGSGDSLEQFVETRGQQDYDELVGKWAGIAGDENVDVRIFHRARMVEGDLLADFASAIDANLRTTARPRRLNDSMPPYQLRLMRGLNRATWPLIEKTPLVTVQRRLFSHNLPRLFGADKVRLSPEQAARVRTMNAASNDRLRVRFFPSEETLFPGVAPGQPEYRPAVSGGTAPKPQRQDKRLWPYS